MDDPGTRDTVAVGHHEHKTFAEKISARCAIITASDSRDLASDKSGRIVEQLLISDGHEVLSRSVQPDEPAAITATIRDAIASGAEAVLINGGTGIAPRDRTFEAVDDLIERPIPGFGELFRSLSYAEIGSAAMLSRSVAGIHDGRLLISMPGSPAAVRLAMEKLVLPEIRHVLSELVRRV